MNPVSFIHKKRQAFSHSPEELKFFLNAYLQNEVADYQMSAWLMAAFLNGLNDEETRCLTETMLHSGEIMDWSFLDAPKADKHSTGGVGDKVSLILAPLAAVCGLNVPMISGRGLGHSGGTLDKMQSVPGFNVHLSPEEFRSMLQKHGLAMAGQTEKIAPLDKRIYALRDVTATVEYIPFIAASIMSKKLSEGLDTLVLDVKSGNGAFMQKEEDALELAKTLVDIGERFGVKTTALLTDMNQPLGTTVGNWLEMKESMDILKGEGADDTRLLTIELTAQMLLNAQIQPTLDAARLACEQALRDGSALQKWLEVAEDQGADIKIMTGEKSLAKAATTVEIESPLDGYINAFDTRAMGLFATDLGAGRYKSTDEIDPVAGFEIFVKRGQKIQKGQTLARVYTNKSLENEWVINQFLSLVKITEHNSETIPDLIRYTIQKDGITKH